MSSSTGPIGAIVVAGGEGRRLGGVDKARLQVGGAALLDRVLGALADADQVVVAGPRRSVYARADVGWTQEVPAGSGPLAGLAAGLAALHDRFADPAYVPAYILVCATDLPWLDAPTVRRLIATLGDSPGAGAAMLEDAEGRRQPLAACYRAGPLASALRAIGDPTDRPVRLLFDYLTVAGIPATRQARDIDTRDDLEVVMLNEWARRVAEELGVSEQLADLELDPILNLARDAAHTIERPAAPVTTFIAGYAAALRAQAQDGVSESSAIESCIEAATRFTLGASENLGGGENRLASGNADTSE